MGEKIDITKNKFKYDFCEFVEDNGLLELKLRSCDFKVTPFEDSIMLSFGDDVALFLERDELAQFAYVLALFLDYEGEFMLGENDEVMTLV